MAIHGGALTQTQENFGDSGGTLAAQLAAGIRMIDIRARVNGGNTFTIHHGATYQNANFDDVLDTARRVPGRASARDRGDAARSRSAPASRLLHRRHRAGGFRTIFDRLCGTTGLFVDAWRSPATAVRPPRSSARSVARSCSRS